MTLERRTTAAAASVVVAAIAIPNLPFWRFVAGPPPRVGLASLGTIARWDLLPLAAVAVFAALCWGAGERVRRALAPRVDGALGACAAFAAGLGACAQAAFLLGLCGVLNRAALAVAGVVLAALALPELAAAPARARAALADAEVSPGTAAGLAAGLAASWAGHALVVALAPPTEWDALSYHLALPALYARTGAVAEVPWMMHSHWPHLMEALYAVPLAFGSDGAAALLHAAACTALLVAVFAAARRESCAPAAALGALFVACQPVVLRLSGVAHSDGALALFSFLSAAFLWEWRRGGASRDARVLAFAGLLAGFASAAKLHGIGLAAVWTAWILVDAPRGTRVRAAALYLACALALVGPWYAKTWAGTGDPLWPFAAGLFGGRFGPEVVLASSRKFNWLAWSELPRALWDAGAAHLLFPFVAAAGWAASRREKLPPFVAFLLVPVAPYALAVCRRTEVWRFLWPCYPALALVAGWAAARAWDSRATAARLAAAAAVAFGLLPRTFASENNQLFAVLGARSASRPDADPRELFADRSVDHAAFYRATDAALAGSGAKVLLWREIRGYGLSVDYLWGDPGNQGLVRYDRMEDSDALAARLRELGVTHVLVNEGLGIYRPGQGDYTERVVALMDGVLARGRVVAKAGALSLVALEAPR